MVTLIIVEKSTVAQNVACALAKYEMKSKDCEDCIAHRLCKYQIRETVLTFDRWFAENERHKFYGISASSQNPASKQDPIKARRAEQIGCILPNAMTCQIYLQRDRPPYLRCPLTQTSLKTAVCRHSVIYTSKGVDRPVRNVSRRVNRFTRLIKNLNEAYWINYENIRYYVIPTQQPKYIILSTDGTMLNFKYRTHREHRNPIVNLRFDLMRGLPPEWILGNFWYVPNRFKNRTYLVRSFLFREALVEECFGEIDQIVVATDVDPAGSFIGLSILEKAANEGCGKLQGGVIQLKRANLVNMSPEKIVRSIREAGDFDWSRAYAGKLRSILDYIYGQVIPLKLREECRRQGLSGRHSFGRVQTGALGVASKEQDKLRPDSWRYYLYFVSSNCYSAAELFRQLRSKQAFCAFLRKRQVSLIESDFIRALKSCDIGTHTTRARQLTKLERSRLLTNETPLVQMTDYGQKYFRVVEDFLESANKGLSTLEFNKSLNQDMMALSNLEAHQETCESKFMTAFSAYLSKIRETISVLNNKYPSIARQCSSLSKNYPQLERTEKRKKPPEEVQSQRLDTISRNKEGGRQFEQHQLISMDDIDKLLRLHEKRPRLPLVFFRNVAVEMELPPHEKLRMALGIPHGVEIDFLHYQDTESFAELLDAINPSRDVFVTELLETGPLWISSVSEMSILEVIDLLEAEVESGKFSEIAPNKITDEERTQYSKDQAHKPLHITEDIRPGIIKGPDGRLLLSEITSARRRARRRLKGEKTLLEFEIYGQSFKRAEYHPTFKTHNYESILRLMNEKYGWELSKTAKMLEDIYLGRRG